MSTTRESTLRHLKHMVAAATVLGCDKPDATIDKDRVVDSSSMDATADGLDAYVPDSSLAADASDASIADVSAPDTSTAMRTPPACPPGRIRRPDGTCGYMVVDPIPRPSRAGTPPPIKLP